MKKIILLCVLIFWGLTHEANAQKKTKQVANYTYTQLPLTPLPESVKTYRIQTGRTTLYGTPKDKQIQVGTVEYTGKVYANIPAGEYKDREFEWEDKFLMLNGYNRDQKNADVEIELSFKNLRIESDDQNRTKPCGTAKNGRNLWTTQFVYSCPTELIVRNKKTGKIILQEVIYDESIRKKNINEMDIGSLGYHSNELYQLMSYVSSGAYAHASRLIRSYLSKEPVDAQFTIFSYASKKHDYSDLNQAQEILMTAFQQGDFSALEKAITIYDKAIKASSVNDKKARINAKVTEGVHHNLALAYFLSGDFEKAKATLSHVKSKTKTGKNLGLNNFLKNSVKVSFNGKNAGSMFGTKANQKLTKNINSSSKLLALILDTETRLKANGKL